MRILYGVQGTGNGHLARARALYPALRNAGVEVDLLFSGRKPQDYFNMELFGSYQCVDGLTLVYDNGTLRPWQTSWSNKPLQFVRDIRTLDLAPYDLVISDFEPVVAWAARRRGIPSIGISHQCAFSYPVPAVSGYTGSRLLIKHFAPVDINVGLHWHHFNQPILPPLIEHLSACETDARKIVVYMPCESLDKVLEWLNGRDYGIDFHVFARVPNLQTVGKVTLHPLSFSEFRSHLENCAGVISNAGFELASECLALGKKLLIKPLAGQFEQLNNALALQTLERATIVNRLCPTTLATWLDLPEHKPASFPNVATALADWVKSPQRPSLQTLSNQLWSRARLSYQFNENYGDRIAFNPVS